MRRSRGRVLWGEEVGCPDSLNLENPRFSIELLEPYQSDSYLNKTVNTANVQLEAEKNNQNYVKLLNFKSTFLLELL